MAEEHYDDDVYQDEAPMDADALLGEAQMDAMATRASWHLLPKEVFGLLFANCLMFAGVMGAWSRTPIGEAVNPTHYITGLDTIRGTAIFALCLYGFWTAIFNVFGRQMKIWPYMLGSAVSLWIGVSGIMKSMANEALIDGAAEYLAGLHEAGESYTKLEEWMAYGGIVPPAYWALTAGGALVAVILLKAILGGASSGKGKAPKAEKKKRGGGGGGRRRR